MRQAPHEPSGAELLRDQSNPQSPQQPMFQYEEPAEDGSQEEDDPYAALDTLPVLVPSRLHSSKTSAPVQAGISQQHGASRMGMCNEQLPLQRMGQGARRGSDAHNQTALGEIRMEGNADHAADISQGNDMRYLEDVMTHGGDIMNNDKRWLPADLP